MDQGRKPLARTDNLIVEELGDELLVYDVDADRGHSLSPDAARVWRACDGTTTIGDIVARLGLDAGVTQRALDELDSCELLKTPVGGSTRREIGLKLVKAGAAVAAAPLIVSVTAPTPAMAQTLNFCMQFSSQSCGTGGNGCKVSGCCCCTPPFPGSIKQCVDVFANCPPNANTCN